jgi:hypothetical protein
MSSGGTRGPSFSLKRGSEVIGSIHPRLAIWSAARDIPQADPLTITADSGGSNSPHVHLWKAELQQLTNETGLAMRVLHFPLTPQCVLRISSPGACVRVVSRRSSTRERWPAVELGSPAE